MVNLDCGRCADHGVIHVLVWEERAYTEIRPCPECWEERAALELAERLTALLEGLPDDSPHYMADPDRWKKPS